KLIWNRNPENIASNITYELPGVSISNETDWTQMAKFNAEQSKKLADVILPILKGRYPNIRY
ncbi:MAG: DUF4268 domain-containing protein, partial [Mailhella sp.]|nr:DUF4268 domain-containing protein [Mailhella sp.]